MKAIKRTTQVIEEVRTYTIEDSSKNELYTVEQTVKNKPASKIITTVIKSKSGKIITDPGLYEEMESFIKTIIW